MLTSSTSQQPLGPYRVLGMGCGWQVMGGSVVSDGYRASSLWPFFRAGC